MIETIIILSILLVVVITYVIIMHLSLKKVIEKEKENAVGSFFASILSGGYEKRVNDFKVYNELVTDKGIVFVGDSLTENYNVYEYFKGLNVYNRGIGGDTTIGLLKRMKESVYDLNPKLVVLLIGINDFELVENSNVDTIFENINKIINNIHDNCKDTKIILESLYPVCKTNDLKIEKACVMHKDNDKIQSLNEKLKTIKNVSYVDVYCHLVDETNNLKIECTMEGLHINTVGYKIITQVLLKEIEKIL